MLCYTTYSKYVEIFEIYNVCVSVCVCLFDESRRTIYMARVERLKREGTAGATEDSRCKDRRYRFSLIFKIEIYTCKYAYISSYM